MNQTLLIDFDSTFITKETLDVLAAISLTGRDNQAEQLARIQKITEAGMNGTITFEQSLCMRLQELPISSIHLVQAAQYLEGFVSPSLSPYKDQLRQNADDIFIISGGFKEVIVPIVSAYGIDESHVFANEFHASENGSDLCIDANNPLATERGKIKVSKKLRDEGLFKPHVIAIGDGFTDWQLWESGVADTFVAFTETVRRESIVKNASMIAASFTEVADFLGWQRPTAPEGQTISLAERYPTMSIRSRR